MPATLAAAAHHTPSVSSVPMLDVSRENNRLRDDLDAAIAEVCRSGAFVHGPACARLEAAVASYCGTAHAVGCASGSDALLLPLMALGIGPGDEVILPSFTFFATAGAVWRLGARPVFVDIDPVTFNLSPGDLIGKITTNTKAIIPIHLFGQCAAMDEIRQIASAARNIPIIEDACQAIGAEFGGRRAGSLGWCAALSFYPTKNLGGFGDGGMITTNDGELAAKLRILRDHGQQPRYYHHYVGLNSRLDTLQAAVLEVKLPHLDDWAAARAEHAERYETEFGRRGLAGQVVTPKVAQRCTHVWNQYTVRITGGRRDALQKHLSERQIGAAIYYPVPLHLQKCFAALGYREGALPATERAAREVLSLPVYPELTAAEQSTVIDAISHFCQVKSQVPQRGIARGSTGSLRPANASCESHGLVASAAPCPSGSYDQKKPHQLHETRSKRLLVRLFDLARATGRIERHDQAQDHAEEHQSPGRAIGVGYADLCCALGDERVQHRGRENGHRVRPQSWRNDEFPMMNGDFAIRRSP